MRGNRLHDHQYSTSDGPGLFFSSPSDLSPASQSTPPAIQAISINDYGAAARRVNTNDQFLRQASFTPYMEGTSANPYGAGSASASSCSDSSESEFAGKPCLSSSRHFSMSKPVHPLASSEPNRWSSASSGADITEVSNPFEHESSNQPRSSPLGFKCGLCERFLSQRSPWSTRRIVRTGDLPIASVLSCRHAFHAECLDQTTPKTRKDDPLCPICHGLEEDCPEHRIFPRLKSGFPRLKPVGEDGPSRPWGCGQVGDCVEGALHVPPRNTMMLLNRNRMKRNLSLRSNSTKEFPGKLRKSSSFYSHQFNGNSVSSDQGAGSNSASATPSMKKL